MRISFKQNLLISAYYNSKLLLIIDCLGGLFCFAFQSNNFTQILVLSDLITQTGLFQHKRWLADSGSKEHVDQDVALFYVTAAILIDKTTCSGIHKIPEQL